MGTQSHGNEANNSFVLWAYGERLLIRTGHYYIYGGDHHRDWMWSTRSLNNITVGGQGQSQRSAGRQGRNRRFPDDTVDRRRGGRGGRGLPSDDPRQGRPAAPLLDRYTRTILFVKPELVIVFDRLPRREPSTFEYWLHAANEFQVGGQRTSKSRAGDVRLRRSSSSRPTA